MKIYRMSMAVAVLFVFGFSTSHAQMMMGQGGKQGMMGQGKGMMCDKMGMMGQGGQSGMMGQGMMGEGEMMHQRYMEKGLHLYFKNKETLGLTDEQLEKLYDIKVDFKKSYIMEKARLKVARIELEGLLDEDGISMRSVEEKVKEIASLKENLILAAVKTRVDAKKVLTDEQRAKAKTFMHQKKYACEMVRGGMGMMGGGGMMGGMGESGSMDRESGEPDIEKTEREKLGENEESHEEHH